MNQVKPPSPLTILGFAAGVASLLIVLSAPIGYRMELLPLRLALGTLLRWGAYVGVAAAIISLAAAGLTLRQKRRGMRLALIGLLLGAVAFGFPASQQRRARGAPGIHDISTDTEDPPSFVAVLPLRANAPNTATYGGESVAVQQHRAYPDIVPVMVEVSPSQAFDRALTSVSTMGWELVAADPGAGRVEATDTTFWFGFKDDIVVRVRPADRGSRIDVRSVSRVGRGDAGTNAARIRAYVDELTTQ